MDIKDLISQGQHVQKWQKGIKKENRQLLLGLSQSIKHLVMASALDQFTNKIVVMTSTQNESEKISTDLASLVGDDKVYQFFTDDSPIAEFVFSSKDRNQSRIEALNFLLDKEKEGFLVLNYAAIRILLPTVNQYQDSFIELTVGQEKEIDTIVNLLSRTGYKKVSRVLTIGEFSRRGDILDIYDSRLEQPIRIEFFGDEIDGIRFFDIEKQTSISNLDSIRIHPASEVILNKEDFKRAEEKIKKAIEHSSNGEQTSYLEEVLADCKSGYRHPDLRKFLSFFYEKERTILDYLPQQTPIFYDDFHKIMEKHAQFEKEAAELLTEDLQKGKAVSSLSYFADSYQKIRKHLPSTFFSSFQRGLGNLTFDAIYQFTQHSMQEFFHQMPLLIETIHRYEKSGYTVLLQASSEQSLHNLKKSLEDYQLSYPIHSAQELVLGETQLFVGQLASGFQFLDEKIALITEKEIFNKKIKKRLRRKNISNAERIKDYNELEVGDYVVHHVHGIGQYLGIETIEISGIHRDYITIQYQQSDRISLPVEQIDQLSKYVASDGKTPKINKLNDGRFQKTKQRSKNRLKISLMI
ncbi:Transcription-repair coupling factor [Streptococcus sp. DD13]|nr:Transcription-repair coupling factor [Streptococcus sp. DD13]